MGIPAAKILAIAGDDNFRRHLLFMCYTLGIKFIDAFHMADAERDFPLEVKQAEYIAAHWHDDLKGDVNATESAIVAKVGGELQTFGGLLRCTVCGFERPLGSVTHKLRRGWPEHCGYTMRWVTQRQLDEEPADFKGNSK